MIERSYDVEKLRTVGDHFIPDHLVSPWLMNTDNVMLVSGDDIGLATYDYPGVYTVHWFFVSRGRAALKLAREMFRYMFEHHDAKTLRGLTPINLPAARWASRQVGLKSHGIVEATSGPHELFLITRDEFEGQNK